MSLFKSTYLYIKSIHNINFRISIAQNNYYHYKYWSILSQSILIISNIPCTLIEFCIKGQNKVCFIIICYFKLKLKN